MVAAGRAPTTTVAILLALAALLAAATPAGAANGFQFGVAATEVDSDSAILWARADRSGAAIAQVVPGGGFGPCKLGSRLGSKSAGIGVAAGVFRDNDRTVQRKVGGLRPETTYRYRFCMGSGARSAVGTFETAPTANDPKTIHFALSGDQDALPLRGRRNPYWNRFQIWNRIRREGNDFNILLGDTIYSDTEVPGYGVSDVATTTPQKWRKYRLNLGQTAWTRARGGGAYYAHWDDHEFINSFSKFENTFPVADGEIEINGKVLYRRSLKAFRNYNPITYTSDTGIYRSFRWGRNLELFFLDERSFRSPTADYGGSCDNPPGSGNPDAAPTAPQTIRDLFAVAIPSLANPPPPECLEKINDPRRTMLGRKQLARFEREIESSTATFKVIVNELPIQQYYALPYDRWEGYAAERTKVLEFLRHNVENAVFLSTDEHANLVNDARLQTLEPGGPVDSGIMDIVTGPIASATYADEMNGFAGSGSATLIRSLFFKPQPPNGVGMECAGLDSYSYAEVTVSRRRLKVELKDIHGDTVTDTADSEMPGGPCGPYVIRAQNHPPAG